MADSITTCHSFPELIEELQGAKRRGARLVTAAPDAQLGQAVGFKLSDGNTYRLTLAKVTQFGEDPSAEPKLRELWESIATTDGRTKLIMTC